MADTFHFTSEKVKDDTEWDERILNAGRTLKLSDADLSAARP